MNNVLIIYDVIKFIGLLWYTYWLQPNCMNLIKYLVILIEYITVYKLLSKIRITKWYWFLRCERIPCCLILKFEINKYSVKYQFYNLEALIFEWCYNFTFTYLSFNLTVSSKTKPHNVWLKCIISFYQNCSLLLQY